MSIIHYIQLPVDALDQRNKKRIKLIQEVLVDNDKFKNKKLSLGFSGGKDSSLTLMLTLMAMLQAPREKLKTLHVLYSDTLMELLPVQAHTYKILENIKTFAKEHNLPIVVMHAKPELKSTMWSLQIGIGFRPPSTDNRYCTSRLKTDVQEDMLFKTFGTQDIETISIVGSRSEESPDRAKRLKNNTIDGHLKGHSEFAKSLVYAPIEDYTTDEVWASLRSNDLGHSLLAVEELYALYATTNGEGAECQTILGNAGKSGKNPGCSQSGGRFGCWNCGLQHGKDAALTGMQKTFPYIKYLIRYRNWSSSIRDGNWEIYRDVYNHKLFTRLQYNLDNPRFGMTCPGGMSLKTRKLALMRLLWTEKKVNETEKFELVSDAELEFIQQRWIYEGDFELTAQKIARRFERDVKVSEDDMKMIQYAKAIELTSSIWSARVVFWYNIHQDKRFAIQFVKQIVKKYSYEKLESIIQSVLDGNATTVAEHLKHIQLKNQFYPSKDLDNLIKREWRDDTISHVTQALVNDFEKTWGDEEVLDEYDVLEDENISMEDKYAMLDNWNTYVGEDTNDKFVHPEYMSLGGNYQYVNFRERQSEENRSKNKKIRTLKVPVTARVQQSFSF